MVLLTSLPLLVAVPAVSLLGDFDWCDLLTAFWKVSIGLALELGLTVDTVFSVCSLGPFLADWATFLITGVLALAFRA